MARTNNTPVSYWMSLPLRELVEWIAASNHLSEEIMSKRKK